MLMFLWKILIFLLLLHKIISYNLNLDIFNLISIFMKRIFSILVGVGCTLAAFAVAPISENQTPRMLNTPSWDGFDVECYREMDFVKPGAKTHLIGKLDGYDPLLEYSVVEIYSYDHLNEKRNVEVAELDSAGNFVVDLPLPHPQTVTLIFGRHYRKVFLMPEDTLKYTTSTTLRDSNDYSRAIYSKFEGGDAADVNIACEFMCDSLNRYKRRYAVVNDPDSMLVINAKIKAAFHDAVDYLNRTIPTFDMSQWAKDVTFSRCAADVYLPIVDMDYYYRELKYNFEDRDGMTIRIPNPEYRPLDYSKYFNDRKDYLVYIYDNPLILCGDNLIISRIVNGSMFYLHRAIAAGGNVLEIVNGEFRLKSETILKDGESRLQKLMELDERCERNFGIGNCFMSQLAMTYGVVPGFKNIPEFSKEMLDYCKMGASVILSEISYKGLAASVIDGVSDIAVGLALKEARQKADSESRTISDVSDVLAEIISPYKGKVILVDVWNTGCGPCLSGMLDQKGFIKEYADSPLQVIYVAEERYKEPCERWIEENEIAGEHVYLTQDAYAHLSADFNITGIPFGIVINKDGEIVSSGHPFFQIDLVKSLLNK